VGGGGGGGGRPGGCAMDRMAHVAGRWMRHASLVSEIGGKSKPRRVKSVDIAARRPRTPADVCKENLRARQTRAVRYGGARRPAASRETTRGAPASPPSARNPRVGGQPSRSNGGDRNHVNDAEATRIDREGAPTDRAGAGPAPLRQRGRRAG